MFSLILIKPDTIGLRNNTVGVKKKIKGLHFGIIFGKNKHANNKLDMFTTGRFDNKLYSYRLHTSLNYSG
jgi:hypothetical protein